MVATTFDRLRLWAIALVAPFVFKLCKTLSVVLLYLVTPPSKQPRLIDPYMPVQPHAPHSQVPIGQVVLRSLLDLAALGGEV